MPKSSTSRKFLLALLLIPGLFAGACKKEEEPTCQPSSEFVKANGRSFELCGQPFRFAGTNNYYLTYKSREAVDDVLESAVAMNLRVVRFWGFLDGAAQDGVTLQPQLGVYDEAGFARMDYVIARAGELGLRVVIPLVNYWDDFGGMKQYLEWALPTGTKDDFYRNGVLRAAYRGYVEHVIRRTNTITGVPYVDDPTIMTWELTNEARADSDPTGATLLAWTDEMSRLVRDLDPNHLIALGDEGHMRRPGAGAPYDGSAGVDWEQIIRLPFIDYGTMHLYTQYFSPSGDGVGFEEKAGTDWILQHIAAADLAEKPVVLEEYGIKAEAGLDRSLIYRAWNDAMLDNGGDGTMFWILSGIDDGGLPNDLYPDYDGFRVYYPSDDADLLADYAARMNGEDRPRRPEVAFYAPVTGELLRREVPVALKLFSYGRELESLSVSTTGATKRLALEDPDGDGYYTGAWDPTADDDDVALEAIARFKDGVRAGQRITIRRPSAPTMPVMPFTFAAGLEGWRSDGVYMASFAAPEVEHAPAVGGGALQVNAQFSGVQGWEEVRVAKDGLAELATAAGVQFDLLFPEALVPATGALNPYVVFDPGWTKLGVDGSRTEVAALERVEDGGVAYRKLTVSVAVPASVDVRRTTSLHLGLVGSSFAYSGPIYVDNVTLLVAP